MLLAASPIGSICEPEQLIAKKRRNRLAAADKAVCYLTRGTFKEDSNDAGFIDTRWVELEELYENCGKTPLHSGARRPACMQHKHTAHRCRSSRCGQSQHRPASAWACAVWLA